MSTLQLCAELLLFSMTVDKRKHPPNSGTAVLTDIDKLIIIETRPDIYLREITEVLVNETGTHVDVSTIWRFFTFIKYNQTEDGSCCQAKK